MVLKIKKKKLLESCSYSSILIEPECLNQNTHKLDIFSNIKRKPHLIRTSKWI